MKSLIQKETELLPLAFEFLKAYSDYSIFTLQGDLGAGKTTFTKYIAQALGATQKVTSPTFSLVNEYAIPNNRSIFHMDLYRLEDEEELMNVGFEDYLIADGYCIIEWPSIAKVYLDKFVEIQIHLHENNSRTFQFIPHDNF